MPRCVSFSFWSIFQFMLDALFCFLYFVCVFFGRLWTMGVIPFLKSNLNFCNQKIWQDIKQRPVPSLYRCVKINLAESMVQLNPTSPEPLCIIWILPNFRTYFQCHERLRDFSRQSSTSIDGSKSKTSCYCLLFKTHT